MKPPPASWNRSGRSGTAKRIKSGRANAWTFDCRRPIPTGVRRPLSKAHADHRRSIPETRAGLKALGNAGTRGYTVVIDAINRVVVSAMLAAKREDGQTFVEYALISVLVAVGLTLALTTFKGAISGALTNIGNAL